MLCSLRLWLPEIPGKGLVSADSLLGSRLAQDTKGFLERAVNSTLVRVAALLQGQEGRVVSQISISPVPARELLFDGLKPNALTIHNSTSSQVNYTKMEKRWKSEEKQFKGHWYYMEMLHYLQSMHYLPKVFVVKVAFQRKANTFRNENTQLSLVNSLKSTLQWHLEGKTLKINNQNMHFKSMLK